MRIAELYVREDTTAALFPDGDADRKGLAIDPNTGLYLTSTKDAHRQGSPYFGVSVFDKIPGKFIAQLNVIQRIVPAIEQSVRLGPAMRQGTMPNAYVGADGTLRPKLKLGIFDNQLEAAYALQSIRFSGEQLEDHAIDFLTQQYITKDLVRPWPPAIENMPDFSKINPISLQDYKVEDYLNDVEDRQTAAKKETKKRQNISANIQRAIDNLKGAVLQMIKKVKPVDDTRAEGILSTLVNQFAAQTADYQIKDKKYKSGNSIEGLRVFSFFVENPKQWLNSI